MEHKTSLSLEDLTQAGAADNAAGEHIVRVKYSVRKNDKGKGDPLFSGHKDFTVKFTATQPTTGVDPGTRESSGTGTRLDSVE
jgi:hypothetical protein